MTETEIKVKAKEALNAFLGGEADFRPGQYEAIEATLTNRRTLVVQRTGWGKSMVYFICTKLLRDEKHGLTMIISPLLALMDNQMDAAKKAGLECDFFNSKKTDKDKKAVIEKMLNNELDLVFVTPESLFNGLLQEALKDLKIGLFVIDEAHCISTWGHDFRLEYSHLNKVIRHLPGNVPLLATTATANDRVIEDLKEQFGGDVFVSRGPLMRKNLSIQILNVETKAERYAWMYENIPRLEGSGIVYCLTHDDCDEISGFLNANGISAMAYYSMDSKKDEPDPAEEAEQLFMNNEIKVIVATTKLGMGYDKGDIAFVIHYQTPESIVAYYQQIGRAGRNIKRAYTFLMNGKEDMKIHEYFRKSAFPTEFESISVYESIAKDIDNTEEGIGLNEIENKVNIADKRVRNTLRFLTDEGFIYGQKIELQGKRNPALRYFPSTNSAFEYNRAHYEEIIKLREKEYSQMEELLETEECYNRFTVNVLDDKTTENCGLCSNCLGFEEFSSAVSDASTELADAYLESHYLEIKPRKKWPQTSFTSYNSNIKNPNEYGICLSRYGHPGYGELVRRGKYDDNRFCDVLVEKSAKILTPFVTEHGITALTYVPSLRSGIVRDFAERLAEQMGLPCLTLLKKTGAEQQKMMENSSFQCENAYKSFSGIENETSPKNILLIDDMVDSKWTLTVCGDILTRAGAEKVYPYALASTAKRIDD